MKYQVWFNNPAFANGKPLIFLQQFAVDKTDIISNYRNEEIEVSKITRLGKCTSLLRSMAGFRQGLPDFYFSALTILYYYVALCDYIEIPRAVHRCCIV